MPVSPRIGPRPKKLLSTQNLALHPAANRHRKSHRRNQTTQKFHSVRAVNCCSCFINEWWLGIGQASIQYIDSRVSRFFQINPGEKSLEKKYTLQPNKLNFERQGSSRLWLNESGAGVTVQCTTSYGGRTHLKHCARFWNHFRDFAVCRLYGMTYTLQEINTKFEMTMRTEDYDENSWKI